jgi:uncharacterized protein (TIGR02300 family)
MAAPELGTKQICPNCQAKFYDLNRRPAHCPKCASDFDPEEAVKSRRVRARAVPANYEADEEAEDKVKKKDDDELEDEEVEATPEIDEAVDADPIETDDDAEEPDAVPAPGADDLGVDFEEEDAVEDADDESVPFLEEEDEDLDEEIEGLPGADDE